MQSLYNSLCSELDAALKRSKEQVDALPLSDAGLVTKDEIKADAKALSEQVKAAASKGSNATSQMAHMLFICF